MQHNLSKILLISPLILSSLFITSCNSKKTDSNPNFDSREISDDNSSASHFDSSEQIYDSTEEREIFDSDKIKAELADTKEYPELADFIVKDLNISDSDAKQTRYYYDYIDLDDDGTDEIFVELVGPFTSGSGGDTAMIFKQNNSEIEKIETFTLIRNPIIISDEKTDGWRNIIVKNADNKYSVLKHTANNYTTVNNSDTIDTLADVTGTAIISDDMSKDMEEGNGLYLKK